MHLKSRLIAIKNSTLLAASMHLLISSSITQIYQILQLYQKILSYFDRYPFINYKVTYCHRLIIDFFSLLHLFLYFVLMHLLFLGKYLVTLGRSICFNGKSCVQIVFYVFQYLVTLEKMNQKKIIFGQYKSMTYFLKIIFYLIFWGKQLYFTVS